MWQQRTCPALSGGVHIRERWGLQGTGCICPVPNSLRGFSAERGNRPAFSCRRILLEFHFLASRQYCRLCAVFFSCYRTQPHQTQLLYLGDGPHPEGGACLADLSQAMGEYDRFWAAARMLAWGTDGGSVPSQTSPCEPSGSRLRAANAISVLEYYLQYGRKSCIISNAMHLFLHGLSVVITAKRTAGSCSAASLRVRRTYVDRPYQTVPDASAGRTVACDGGGSPHVNNSRRCYKVLDSASIRQQG